MKYQTLYGRINLRETLSNEEFKMYYEKMKSGSIEARKKIIEHNLRLVVRIARKYENTDYGIDDLVSIGTIGLIKAIDTFNMEKNFQFSSYASRCINNEILMYLRVNKKHNSCVSFEEPLSVDWDGNELHLEDILQDESVHFELDYESELVIQELRKLIEKLPERDKKIAILRYGLNGTGKYNQYEVSEILGVSQPYASRLEKKLLKQLKIVLTQKDLIDEKSENKKTNKISVFDYTRIHPDLTEYLFLKFVSMLPSSEKNIYCMHRGIKENNLIPVEYTKDDYWNSFIEAIDSQIKEMFEYYQKYKLKHEKESKENILNRVIKYMQTKYLPFTFPDYKIKELEKKVKQLNEKQQKCIYSKHGINLMEYHPINKEEQQIIYIAYKKIENLHENQNSITPIEKTSGLSLQEIKICFPYLNKESQHILKERYGMQLDTINKLKSASDIQMCYKVIKRLQLINTILTSNLTSLTNLTGEETKIRWTCLSLKQQNALKYFFKENLEPTKNISKDGILLINDCIRGIKKLTKEPFNYTKKEEIIRTRKNKKILPIREQYPHLTLEELKEKIALLPEKYQTILYLRNGESLDKILPLPKENYKKDYFLYIRANRKLANIIQGKKTRYYKVRQKTKIIIEDFAKEEIYFCMPRCNKKEIELLYLRHTKELNTTIPWPNEPKNYPYHYQKLYDKIQMILEKRKRNQTQVLEDYFIKVLGPYSYDEIFEGIKKLGESASILYLRHGKNLNEVYLYPNDKPLAYYQSEYKTTMNKLEKILRKRKQEQIILEIIAKNSQASMLEEKRQKEENVNNTLVPKKNIEIPNPVEKKQKSSQPKLAWGGGSLTHKETKRKELEQKKITLQQNKYQNEKTNLFNKYSLLYANIIDASTLENIINEVVNNYNVQENISLELACSFEIERKILLYAKDRCTNAKNEEESLQIMTSFEDIYYEKLKNQYSHIEERKLRYMINEAFENYTGKRTLNMELILILSETKS